MAKTKRSRHKRKAHGKNKMLVHQKQKAHGEKKGHGKNKKVTAKAKSSRQKQKAVV